ncbi:hypothetical protein [Komagataeibacter xylinus]|uniref:hypothetical protein n=1 Tax=Komagataeibacter xylinus TaxID=28448 RepID=UPI0012E8E6E6|nr:hypothetical protein [Komagataeibacter xylinus]
MPLRGRTEFSGGAFFQKASKKAAILKKGTTQELLLFFINGLFSNSLCNRKNGGDRAVI